jgi:hypothetical protein
MRRKGLGLVELLVAIAVGIAVMAGAFLTVRQTAHNLSREQKITLSQDQAARVLQGLSGELKDSPAVFLLPGASESGAGLVTLSGTGWPVIAQGYGPSRVRVAGGRPDLQPGNPVVLVSPTGEVFYSPGLASIAAVDAQSGVYELEFAGCLNPLRFAQGMRLYRAESLALAKTANGLEVQGTTFGTQQVLTLKDFTFRYVYASPTGETISSTYQGASLPDGSRLAALAFQATGTTEADRAYTARFPIGIGSMEIRNVLMCGGTPPPPSGQGVVTVVINPVPPGGGDVTLLANGYTRSIRQSSTFWDVPLGEVRVQGRDVWTDSLTAWAPNPVEQRETLFTFAPLTFIVSYSVVPGTLVLSASGFPSDGSATVSAGPHGASVSGGGSQTVSAPPGVYGTSASPEVSVSRSQGSVSWTEVYTLQSVSPAQVTVRSYGSASVTAAYTGPLPGTLCRDGSCQQASPGRYTAPAEQVINTWTNTYTQPCPPGQTGGVTVTELWRTVKYWTPREGGLSSRGVLRFTSATRDEMVDRAESRNCGPIDPSTSTQTGSTQTGPTQTGSTQTGSTQTTGSSVPSGGPGSGLTGTPPDIPDLTGLFDLTRLLDIGPTGGSRVTWTRVPPPEFTILPRPDLADTNRSPSENNNDRGGSQPPLDPSGDFNPRTSLFGLGHDRFGPERPKPRYLLPLPWGLDTQL